MATRRRQQGAVLIVAILIVALVSGLAVSYASQMQLVEARAFNRIYGAQLNSYADSMVEIAKRMLAEDLENGPIDHRLEDWATQQAMFPVDGGWISGRIEDAQAKLNINSLVGALKQSNGNPQDPNRYSEAQRRFIRFLLTFDGNQQAAGSGKGGGGKAAGGKAGAGASAASTQTETPALAISMDQAIEITESLVDWLDADDDPSGFGGAESLQYLQAGLSYAPANGELASLQELKLIMHITPQIYSAISPHLVVLPGATNLNINTIETQWAQSLNAPDSLLPFAAEDVAAYSGWSGEEGFKNTGELTAHPDFSVLLNNKQIDAQGLGIDSNYFWLHVEVQLADKIINRRILLNRNEQGIKLLRQEVSGLAQLQLMVIDDADDKKEEVKDGSDAAAGNQTKGAEVKSESRK